MEPDILLAKLRRIAGGCLRKYQAEAWPAYVDQVIKAGLLPTLGTPAICRVKMRRTRFSSGWGREHLHQQTRRVRSNHPHVGRPMLETQIAPTNDTYDASPIKRFRRTKTAITGIRDAIQKILEADNPQTVRQVFYALTVRGVIKKAEAEYHRTVVRLLADMREVGDIPFEWIADNNRWMRKPTTFVGTGNASRSQHVSPEGRP